MDITELIKVLKKSKYMIEEIINQEGNYGKIMEEKI